VHENGFGVQEEGMPAARRILISDVPGQAVLALLQYLYTAHLTIPPSLRPHVLELAERFDLKPLKQLCELPRKEAANEEDEEDKEAADSQKDQAFLDLLRSMWNEEDEENEVAEADERQDKEDVNERELEEIYEFAATQRKRNEEAGGMHAQEERDS
ncbi:unnamed protein product, partial [Tetraodon nigroviridis]